MEKLPKTAKKELQIHTCNIKPVVGSVIILDERCCAEKLLPGDDYCDSSFPGCDFRYPSRIANFACNIWITGRKVLYMSKWGYKPVIRICVEWVGDGEPNTYSSGYMFI